MAQTQRQSSGGEEGVVEHIVGRYALCACPRADAQVLWYVGCYYCETEESVLFVSRLCE